MTLIFDFLGWWCAAALLLVWGLRELMIRGNLAEIDLLRGENERLVGENETLEKENHRIIKEAARAWGDLWWLSANVNKASTEVFTRRIHLAYDRIQTMIEPSLAKELKAGDA